MEEEEWNKYQQETVFLFPVSFDNKQRRSLNHPDRQMSETSRTRRQSQLRACEDLLTKRAAIIQGPQGTGKTFVSVKALKVMLDNFPSSQEICQSSSWLK